jgi:hypothetical protein
LDRGGWDKLSAAAILGRRGLEFPFPFLFSFVFFFAKTFPEGEKWREGRNGTMAGWEAADSPVHHIGWRRVGIRRRRWKEVSSWQLRGAGGCVGCVSCAND